MKAERWIKPSPLLPLPVMNLLFFSLVLCLPACSGSLARLPSEEFEIQAAKLDQSDPLSVEAYLSTQHKNPRLAPELSALANKDILTASRSSDSADGLVNVNAVNAPVGALLHALASQAQLQLRLMDELSERVTLKLEQQSLETALNHLADQAGFFWNKKDKQIIIRNGAAYANSYSVDYLNIERRTESSVGLATQVGTINASDVTANSIANSSQTRVENISEHQFWTSLQIDVEQMLAQLSVEKNRAPTFTLNREAGLLTLHATPEVHRTVQGYLSTLQASARRQVLIEATVVEVALSDSYETGVDWQVLANGVSGLSAVQALVGVAPVTAQSIDRIVAPSGLVSLVQQGSQGSVSATLSLLEQFGDVRILSRPRIIALNNQSSVLKVVDNRVYFTVNIERRQSETRDEVVTETEIHTVPVGLVMNVTPQISESGAVMLNVRPTLSRILGFVNDPNPELAQANVRNGVPEIQVREMESMLRVQSGNMAIIGGLMQESSEENDSQLPGLGRLPVLGRLFSQTLRKRRQTELLIVLRPTVVEADTRVVASR